MFFLKKFLWYLNLWWATALYLGFLPISGTMTSFAVLVGTVVLIWSATIPWEWMPWVWGGGAVIFSVVGIATSNYAVRQIFLKKDPSEVVIDEVAGMWISFAPIFLLPKEVIATGQTSQLCMLLYGIVAFALFRFFDISKLGWIGRMEKLKDGWGVMLDDILAGVVSAVILRFVIWLQNFLI